MPQQINENIGNIGIGNLRNNINPIMQQNNLISPFNGASQQRKNLREVL